MAMSEEQKKNAAERMRKTRAAKKEAAEKVVEEVKEEQKVVEETAAPVEEKKEPTFTKEEVDRIVAEAIAKVRDASTPTIIQVQGDQEKIVLRFQAEVADDNVAVFGDGGYYGRVTGKRGILTVPKSDFSRFYSDQVQYMLDHRMLIVLSGMTDDERELYGVKYREGEFMDEMAFAKMLDMSSEEMLAIFPKLCNDYKEMVARRFVTAFQQGDERVTKRRELVKQLNDMTKGMFADKPDSDARKRGLFSWILEAMNKQDL